MPNMLSGFAVTGMGTATGDCDCDAMTLAIDELAPGGFGWALFVNSFILTGGSSSGVAA